MALFITSLNSGSNGNCYYVGNKNEAILVDAGISCRTIERRLKNLNLNILNIQGIFISHEHTDHIKGVETISRKYNLPIFISELTYKNSGLRLDEENMIFFSGEDTLEIGKLKVHPFSKIHDAADPYSFYVTDGEVNIGVFTDIGRCTEDFTEWFSLCHAAFLEANYDEVMLASGAYPDHLKKRISGGSGHLSNAIAHKLFCEHRSDYLSHLILSHLSQNNNKPEIVETLFKSNCGNVNIIVASRHQETPVFEISPDKRVGGRKTTVTQLTFGF